MLLENAEPAYNDSLLKILFHKRKNVYSRFNAGSAFNQKIQINIFH